LGFQCELPPLHIPYRWVCSHSMGWKASSNTDIRV